MVIQEIVTLFIRALFRERGESGVLTDRQAGAPLVIFLIYRNLSLVGCLYGSDAMSVVASRISRIEYIILGH
jgi:hypothetical protein